MGRLQNLPESLKPTCVNHSGNFCFQLHYKMYINVQHIYSFYTAESELTKKNDEDSAATFVVLV